MATGKQELIPNHSRSWAQTANSLFSGFPRNLGASWNWEKARQRNEIRLIGSQETYSKKVEEKAAKKVRARLWTSLMLD